MNAWLTGSLVASLLLAWLFPAASPGICAVETDAVRPDAGGPPARAQVNLYLADLYEVAGGEQFSLQTWSCGPSGKIPASPAAGPRAPRW
ncbi:MAG: hypothetical protein IH608_11375, partial [Proteobacteria bacterium]|nr:hypothetical protein [Pseudomonadota bacterium]